MKGSGELLAVFGFLMLVGCAPCNDTRGNAWADMVSRIQIGMTRAEVETLLPPDPHSLRMCLTSGGSQTQIYWVGSHWCVSVTYDYSGIHREENGVPLDMVGSANKVLAKPILSEKQMPTVKVDGMETDPSRTGMREKQ